MHSWWGRVVMEHSLQVSSVAWHTHHILLELKSAVGGCTPWKPPNEPPVQVRGACERRRSHFCLRKSHGLIGGGVVTQHADALWRGMIERTLAVLSCQDRPTLSPNEAVRRLAKHHDPESLVAEVACALGNATVHAPMPAPAGPTAFTPLGEQPSFVQRFALLVAWMALHNVDGAAPAASVAADCVNVALRVGPASAPLELAAALLREAHGAPNTAARHWHNLVHVVQHGWALQHGIEDLSWLLRLVVDDAAWQAAHHSPKATDGSVRLWPSKLRHDADQIRALSGVEPAPAVNGTVSTWASVASAYERVAREVEARTLCGTASTQSCPSVAALDDSVTESDEWKVIEATYGRVLHAPTAPALDGESTLVPLGSIEALRGVPLCHGDDIVGACAVAVNVITPQAWDAVASHLNGSLIWHDVVASQGGNATMLGSRPWVGLASGVLLQLGAELSSLVARAHATLTRAADSTAEASWSVVPGSLRAFKVRVRLVFVVWYAGVERARKPHRLCADILVACVPRSSPSMHRLVCP